MQDTVILLAGLLLIITNIALEFSIKNVNNLHVETVVIAVNVNTL